MLIAVRYHFTQRLSIPAREAYEWCTDFTPKDHVLMGEDNSERKVARLAEGALMLTDVFHAVGPLEKQKLVHLHPDSLRWTSTHLSGPNKYSQFVYEISEENDCASRLDFYGLHIENVEDNLDEAGAKLLTERLCREDSKAWELLANAMIQELRK